MATMTRKAAVRARGHDIELTVSRLFAQAFQTFLECDPAIQQVIMDMVAIIHDPETDPDDRAMAEATIHEALFPARSSTDGQLGTDVEEEERNACGEEEQVRNELDQQEACFTSRVESILQDRGWTQGRLAEAIGVGQPAVSLLLSRGSRPQRRTIEKIAKALDVDPAELWPEFEK